LYILTNDTALPQIYTLSLHDALPISCTSLPACVIEGIVALASHAQKFHLNSPHKTIGERFEVSAATSQPLFSASPHRSRGANTRSEEHTSELQSLTNLVCRLLLEKKN